MSTTAMPGLRQGTVGTEDGPRFARRWMMGFAAMLLIFGLMSLYSIQHAHPGDNYFTKQMIFVALGTIIFTVVRRVKLEALRPFSWVLYGISMLALVAVLFAGDERGGAVRWIDVGPLQFQPSELAKVFMIVTLSLYYTTPGRNPRDIRTFLGSLVHLGPVLLLVLKQPHLGGATSLLVIWLVISVTMGVRWSHLLITLAIAILGASSILLGYQQERIQGLLNPDAKTTGYQAQQSMIAFATGGVTGVGYLNGPQKKAGLVPEQQNDFIFSVFGEEFGLAGCSLVLVAFGGLFVSLWLITRQASSSLGKCVAAGVLGVLSFQTVVNIGMVIGVTPVVGLWLPLMSYGGTAMMMVAACLGLASSVR